MVNSDSDSLFFFSGYWTLVTAFHGDEHDVYSTALRYENVAAELYQNWIEIEKKQHSFENSLKYDKNRKWLYDRYFWIIISDNVLYKNEKMKTKLFKYNTLFI